MRMIFHFDRLHHRRYLFPYTGLLQVFDLAHVVSSVVFVLINWSWNVVDLVVDSNRRLLEIWILTEFRGSWAT